MTLIHSGNADLVEKCDETVRSNRLPATNSSPKKTSSRKKSAKGQIIRKAASSSVMPIGTSASVTSKAKMATDVGMNSRVATVTGSGSRVPPKNTSKSGPAKADIVLKKLRLARGVTIAQIVEATSWQAHSVRGFLSGVVKKKLGLDLVSEIGKDGLRHYRIAEAATPSAEDGLRFGKGGDRRASHDTGPDGIAGADGGDTDADSGANAESSTGAESFIGNGDEVPPSSAVVAPRKG